MKMIPEFNSAGYFIDLLALSIILVPIMAAVSSALAKRIIFIFAGMYLLYFIAPRLMLFYIAFWVLVFALQRLVAWAEDKKSGLAVFWGCVLTALAPMVTWKLWYNEFSIAFNLWGNEAVRLISYDLWTIDLARAIIIPIGLSFAVFRAVDLLVKTYIGKFKGLSFDRVLFYGFFPPVQVVGPIIEYEEVETQQKQTAEDFYQGFLRIAFGLIKVLLIAGILQKSAGIFDSYEAANIIKVWGFLFIYTWFFYLNFSGYSDLAIGVSRLYGFQLKENFCFPYFRRNIAEFWNNWHMSLSRFAQRNAFVPLGGYRKQTQYLAILATIMVIALWHDLSLGMIVFGLYHGAGLIVHRMLADKAGKKDEPDALPLAWAKILGTYLFVTLSFPLLVIPLEKAGGFYLSLIGL